MSLEIPNANLEKGTNFVEAARMFADDSQEKLNELEQFLSGEGASLSAKERERIDSLAERGGAFIRGLKVMLDDANTLEEIRHNLEFNVRQPEESREKGAKFWELDSAWREARGLMEEIRWEKQRLMGLVKP